MYDKTPQYLARIQEISESLEQRYTQFKARQMEVFDDLAAEEEILEHELTVFDERLSYIESSKSHPQREQPGERQAGELLPQSEYDMQQSMGEHYSSYKLQQEQENDIDVSNQSEQTDRLSQKKSQIASIEKFMDKTK